MIYILSIYHIIYIIFYITYYIYVYHIVYNLYHLYIYIISLHNTYTYMCIYMRICKPVKMPLSHYFSSFFSCLTTYEWIHMWCVCIYIHNYRCVHTHMKQILLISLVRTCWDEKSKTLRDWHDCAWCNWDCRPGPYSTDKSTIAKSLFFSRSLSLSRYIPMNTLLKSGRQWCHTCAS